MALPFFPEEHIRNIYLSFEMLLSGLLYAERELIHRFNNYFHKFWINGSANLSVFYHEKSTNNGPESYHKTMGYQTMILNPKD